MSQHIDFETIKEPWNEYELSDGTIIKIKIVLKQISRDTSKNGQSYCDPYTDATIVAYPDASLNIEPGDRNWTRDELNKHIDLDGMDMRTIKYEPSEYLLDDGAKIEMPSTFLKVSRTKLHDRRGNRIYLVETKFELIVVKPDS